MIKKVEIINGAYSKLRVSGLTYSPSPEDTELALVTLEGMANEFLSRNICVGYNFEDTPDLNSDSNIPVADRFAFETLLAFRLSPDFDKKVSNAFAPQVKASFSFLSSKYARVRPVQYPSRQPIGSGNSRRYPGRFFPGAEVAPVGCATKTINTGDISDYVERYESYLVGAEVLSSAVITSDTGLTVVSSSVSSDYIDYRIEAESNLTGADEFLKMKIVATTDLGRIVTRIINFNVVSLEL